MREVRALTGPGQCRGVHLGPPRSERARNTSRPAMRDGPANVAMRTPLAPGDRRCRTARSRQRLVKAPPQPEASNSSSSLAIGDTTRRGTQARTLQATRCSSPTARFPSAPSAGRMLRRLVARAPRRDRRGRDDRKDRLPASTPISGQARQPPVEHKKQEPSAHGRHEIGGFRLHTSRVSTTHAWPAGHVSWDVDRARSASALASGEGRRRTVCGRGRHPGGARAGGSPLRCSRLLERSQADVLTHHRRQRGLTSNECDQRTSRYDWVNASPSPPSRGTS